MKGVEKLTATRLAELLIERGLCTSEVINDALHVCETHGDSLVDTLVVGGHITDWDLAKLVTEHFNLPYLLAGSYSITEEAKNRLPKEVLFEHTVVPLDIFGDIVCVAMPVMTTFEQLQKIQKDHSCELFPYVGLISENKKVLGDLFKDYKDWQESETKRREEAAAKRKAKSASTASAATSGGSVLGADWMSIFDAGDAAIASGVKKPAPAGPPAASTPPAAAAAAAPAAPAAPVAGNPSAPPVAAVPPPAAPPKK
ncbi:MAG: hypothetical protein ACK5S5_09920 [Planctomycetota bacterium]